MNENEPKPVGLPECPEWMSAYAKSVWARVLRTQAPGVITQADPDVMTAYCGAVDTYRKATEELQKAGTLTIQTERGWSAHPAVGVQMKASSEIRHLGSLLGLNPASRSRINATPAANDINDSDNWLN